MNHLFIINPASGQKGQAAKLEQRILSLHLENCEIRFTEKQGDARQFAHEAAMKQIPLRIYACGGDGTLNEVCNGAAGHDHVAITNVPVGTGNDFIRLFGENAHDAFLNLPNLITGPQRSFDLIDCNGHLGIDIVCLGVDARIGADVHAYKRIPFIGKHGAYILSLLVNVFFKGIARPMDVSVNGAEHCGDASIFCVCNGRHYGGGFNPVPDAMPDDGVLDMLYIPKISLLAFARLVGKYAKGRYRELSHIITPYHGTLAHVKSSEPTVAVVDGETLIATEFVIKLSEKKINFFFPPALRYDIATNGQVIST